MTVCRAPTAEFSKIVQAGSTASWLLTMGRVGQPEEVATLACYLAPDEVTFSTGAVFDLSEGRATY